MPGPVYNWKRFWCPREGKISLSDGGFLVDPDWEYGSKLNPDVVAFSSIAHYPCLVLLGEPGIGKTTALRAEYASVAAGVRSTGDSTHWMNLGLYTTDARLVDDLQQATAIREWLAGPHTLHLFLDSLDECRLRVETVAGLLAERFEQYPVERLRLRVASRTADWPALLEEELLKLWDKEHVGVFELAPLRRIDVAESAKVNQLDPDRFSHEIERVGAIPLAMKPVTLDLLLREYRASEALPATQSELYRNGCRLLCEESSTSRRAAGRLGDLTADQRLIVAARVAAAMVFSNRPMIWIDADPGNLPGDIMRISDLVGGIETAQGHEFNVTESVVRETLCETGLFSSRGAGRLGWCHQTYGEFLAAYYLVAHGTSVKQMLSLIVHPDGCLIPQLSETAAWLACMVPEVFRILVRTSPSILLRSDVASADPADRQSLVESLLRLCDEGVLPGVDWSLYGRLKKLRYPGISELISSYIRDRSKNPRARSLALHVAYTCELEDLQDLLADTALDRGEEMALRETAASIVARIGSDDAKGRLKPLAMATDDWDDHYQLKGWALIATWPNHLSAVELFGSLTIPAIGHVRGSYDSFVSTHLLRHLRPADLTLALGWVAHQGAHYAVPSAFNTLLSRILVLGWEHLDVPGVLDRFAKAVLARLEHHDGLSYGHLEPNEPHLTFADEEKRRRVLAAIVSAIPDADHVSVWIAWSKPRLIQPRDVAWLIKRQTSAATEKEQRIWAWLLGKVFTWENQDENDLLLEACKRNEILATAFKGMIGPIELGSPEATKLRESHKQLRRMEREDCPSPPLDPPPSARIARALEMCEAGETEAFAYLNMEMTLEANSTRYGNGLETDLTALPGWEAADETTKSRIINAAFNYVSQHNAELEKCLGENNVFHIYEPTFSGYRAFVLLLAQAPNLLSELPAEVWMRWASAILFCPESTGVEKEKLHRRLVGLAYQHAPQEIIDTLMILIDRENAALNHLFILRRMDECWDDRLQDALVRKVQEPTITTSSMGDLLDELLAHQNTEAIRMAVSLLGCPPPAEDDPRTRAILAAQLLTVHGMPGNWPAVWAVIQADEGFGRAVIEGLAGSFDRRGGRVAATLNETELGDLFVWVERHYPHATDPVHEGAHAVGTREAVASWRDGLLTCLKDLGTEEACAELRRIAETFPELHWLTWTLADARDVMRRKTWRPPSPSQVLMLASDSQKRLVESGTKLLDVLIESLERLEKLLQGETPAAVDLWNMPHGGPYTPKDENAFSDYVKRFLEADLRSQGVILNREVEIRRGTAPGSGERTDIHVDAVVHLPNGRFDSITVIIEAKGCWHVELESAMETQLVNRYLKENRCRHGLYLVGWFNCPQWDISDRRRASSPTYSIDDARQRFTDQARRLSMGGIEIRAVVLNAALR